MRNKIKDNPIKGLSFLYNTVVGRIILYPLVNFSFISKLSEKVMDGKISKLFIKRFIKNNNINMDEYIDEKYLCFNDFFIRNIKKDKRPINYKENVLIAPCDSKLTVYDIKEDGLYKIKNSLYSLENLLQDKKLSKEYVNGKLLVFRLSPDDYHHYYNIDNGSILKTYKIKGKYHTVNPIVYDKYDDVNPYNKIAGFVHGTAYAKGNWGTKDSGIALTGELGMETLVRNGRFYTIGDNGAEFIKYKKGDIIFNHKYLWYYLVISN